MLAKLELMEKIVKTFAIVYKENVIMWTEFVGASQAGGVMFVKNRVLKILGALIVNINVNALIMHNVERLMDFVSANLVLWVQSVKKSVLKDFSEIIAYKFVPVIENRTLYVIHRTAVSVKQAGEAKIVTNRFIQLVQQIQKK